MGETYRDESFAFFTFAFCGGSTWGAPLSRSPIRDTTAAHTWCSVSGALAYSKIENKSNACMMRLPYSAIGHACRPKTRSRYLLSDGEEAAPEVISAIATYGPEPEGFSTGWRPGLQHCAGGVIRIQL